MTLYLGNNLISGVAYPTEPTRNLGQIIESVVPLTDAGLHLLDGALINGSGIYADFVSAIGDIYDGGNYPDLFETEANWQTAVTTYGVCGKFVYDSVGNTVRLPKITGIVEGTTDVTALGDLVKAGLPIHTHTRGSMNITGRFGSGEWSSRDYTQGAFYKNGSYSEGSSGGDARNLVSFDASRSWTGTTSNPIYSDVIQNSNTVQPQTIKVLYYIVIATTTKTEIEVDIDQVVTDLNGKADVDLTNVNNSGTSLGAKWAMPSSIYKDITVGAGGTSYTAPANGWFAFDSLVSGSWISLSGNNIRAIACKVSGLDMSGYIPVKKGDSVILNYNGNWTPNTWQYHPFVFVYAVGSESEAS